MKGAKFRLSRPTSGVASLDLQIIVIPAESTIEVLNSKENHHQMVEVDWGGTTVMLFARDIQDRGIPVKRSRTKTSKGEVRAIG